VIVALDFAPVELGNTALEMLVVLVLLTLLVCLLITIGTSLASPLVDRRWPADEPLDPTELLWGESGGYIQKHFQGLDLGESKELATQFVEVTVPAGQFICEQGDPATHFYVLKEGTAEVIQRIQSGNFVREETIRRYKPGDSFGEVAILRRTSRTASIRALSDCAVMQLSAEDFVAGAALSAAEESELLSRVDEYLAADRRRARGRETAALGFTSGAPAPAPEFATPEADAAPHPVVEAPPTPARPPGGWSATHVVPPTGLLAWEEPDPSAQPFATLAGGVEVKVVETTGVWSKLVASNGWQGWVDGRTLLPRQ
jgi:CRP-like cAMP-binding protein